MKGRKLFSAVSLLLLAMAPTCAFAVDVKAQSSTRYLWYNDSAKAELRVAYDALNDLDNTMVFPGDKADFFR